MEIVLTVPYGWYTICEGLSWYQSLVCIGAHGARLHLVYSQSTARKRGGGFGIFDVFRSGFGALLQTERHSHTPIRDCLTLRSLVQATVRVTKNTGFCLGCATPACAPGIGAVLLPTWGAARVQWSRRTLLLRCFVPSSSSSSLPSPSFSPASFFFFASSLSSPSSFFILLYRYLSLSRSVHQPFTALFLLPLLPTYPLPLLHLPTAASFWKK